MTKIAGSGSTPKCHGSATLILGLNNWNNWNSDLDRHRNWNSDLDRHQNDADLHWWMTLAYNVYFTYNAVPPAGGPAGAVYPGPPALRLPLLLRLHPDLHGRQHPLDSQLVIKYQVLIISVVDPHPDPQGSASFWSPESASNKNLDPHQSL